MVSIRHRKERPLASVASGMIRGSYDKTGTVARFLGIPYAAPPIGDLRWRPPQPVESWTGLRDCTTAGPMARQRSANIERFVATMVEGVGLSRARQRLVKTAIKAPRKQSEDCLTINVRTPLAAQRLPVMVWIHGGDQTDGSGTDLFYNTDALTRRGCVLVTFNYRLGLFGWLAHPELSAESPVGVSGNYGLLDQAAALRWVRDNIEAFGGDPNRVTIFGESAGGQGVLNHMTAPDSRGLFHQAIAQSPSDSGRWLHLDRSLIDADSALDGGVAFATAAVGPEPGQLERLRAADADDLSDLYRDRADLARTMFPCVDGVVLPEAPMSAFSGRRQAPVPLVIGFNADEVSLFLDHSHPAGAEFVVPDRGPETLTPAEIRDALSRSYGSVGAEEILRLYPGLDTGDRDARAQFGRAHMFGIHVEHAARQHAEGGHPVYRYFFEAASPAPRQTLGAYHAAELPYVFGSPIPLFPTTPEDQLLTADMGDRWYAFAATGAPNHPGRPQWPRFDPAQPRQMVFDRPRGRVEDIAPDPAYEVMAARIETLTDRARQD